MEYVVAFLILFLSLDMGSKESVPTRPLALSICQQVYPEGKVSLNTPLIVFAPMSGKQTTTHLVWQCMRPVKKEVEHPPINGDKLNHDPGVNYATPYRIGADFDVSHACFNRVFETVLGQKPDVEQSRSAWLFRHRLGS